MQQPVTTLTRLMKLKPLSKASHVVVAGAGVSGLSFGYFLGLLRPDLKVTIVERESRLGGYIRSQRTEIEGRPATVLEKGPRTLRGVSAGTLLIADILHRTGNLDVLNGVHMTSKGNKKYLMAKTGDGSKLVTVPGPGESLSTMLTYLCSSPGRQTLKALFVDLFRTGPPDVYDPHRDLSVEEYFTKHFGKGMSDEVASALMHGIYAADVKNLSVRCVLPAMAELGEKSPSLLRHALKTVYEARSKSKMEALEREVEKKDDALAVAPLDSDVIQYSKEFKSNLNMSNLRELLKRFPMLAFKGGLETLINVLKTNLGGNVKVISEAEVTSIEKKGDKVVLRTSQGQEIECDHLRSTVSAQSLQKAFKDEEIANTLATFKYTSVTVANIYVKKNIKSLQGFGFLIPKALFHKEKRLMGVIFDSDVESSAKPIFNAANIAAVESQKNINMTELAKEVHTLTPDSQPDYTKVTFMFNIDSESKDLSSKSKLSQIVAEVFDTHLGVDLAGENWFMEHHHYMQAIPLYDTEYLSHKRTLIELLKRGFDTQISLGGMAFSRGVGVPDCVLQSFQDALQLAKQ